MRAATAHPATDPLAVIRRLLAAVRRSARGWIWVEALSWAAGAAVAAAWTSLLVDRLVEPPAWVRGALLAAAAAVLAWVIVTRLVLRLVVPLRDESLALAVERAHPEFGDGLSTAVSCAARGTADVDPDLVSETIAHAAARAGRVKPATVFRRRRLTAGAAAAAAAVAVTIGAAAARPADAATWVRRMLWLSSAPWPRRLGLEPEGFADGMRVVARGDDVEVLVRAVPAWGGPPDVVDLRSRGRGGWRVDRMGARGGSTAAGQVFGHVLKAVDADLDLEIRGGDARCRGLRLVVADPPAVAALAIEYTPPEYLGAGPRRAVASRIVAVPRGSVVDLSCAATAPLAAATLSIRRAAADGAAEPVEEVLGRLDAAARGTASIAARTPPIDVDTAVLVRMVDEHGLVNREPVAVMLAAVPDEPPQVAVRLAGVSTAVTPAAVLPLEGTIGDDHGLARASVRLKTGDAIRDLPIERAATSVATVELTAERPELIPLAPLGLTVGTRLEVSVSATDRCTLGGGPQESVGESWQLDVVTPEALLAMLEAREVLLRRRLEAVIDDLVTARARAAAEPGAADRDAAAVSDAAAGDATRDDERDRDPVAARCGEAAARAGGETGEIAAEFRGIHRELAVNGLATPDREARLVGQIAAPLDTAVSTELAAAVRACRAAGGPRGPIVAALDAAVARLKMVLERMLELETMNEVIERLRDVIRIQEAIRADTLERQRRRGREALESP